MQYALEWQRVVSLIAAICIVLVAVGVIVYRPYSSPNRRLSFMLVAHAAGLGGGWSMGMMAQDPGHAAAWIRLGWAGYAALVPLYLLFLGTLSTPLTRPLNSRLVRVTLWSLAVVGPLVALIAPEMFFTGLVPRPGTGTFVQTPGPLGVVLPALHAVPLPIFGLVVAIDRWRRTSSRSLHRRQAGAYVLAFGWRDLNWLILLAVLPAATGSSITDSDLTPTLVYGLMEFGFMVLVVYGILSTQLFDIDVKARFVIRQSTVAAAAAVLFFVVSYYTEHLLDFDRWLPALLWAGVVAITFGQLQKLGSRVATRVLPPVNAAQDTAHKLQFYQAAVAGFEVDGQITAREAAALARLRERLGLSAADVATLTGSVQHGDVGR